MTLKGKYQTLLAAQGVPYPSIGDRTRPLHYLTLEQEREITTCETGDLYGDEGIEEHIRVSLTRY